MRKRSAGAMQRRVSRRTLMKYAMAAAGTTTFASCRFTEEGEDVPTVGEEESASPAVEQVEGFSDPNRWSGKEIVIASPGDDGGEYQQAQINAIYEPFQRLTGAEIRTVRTDLTELRRQVNSGEVTWSVCDVPAEEVLPLANAGIIDEIDYAQIDSADLFPGLRMDHGVGASLYSTVLAYRTDNWDDTPPPASWADFWDTDTYEGLRGLQENPVATFEFALLADGVPISELYPIDIDRALASLERLQESILLWWRQGAQPTQMIASGDVTMVAAWHNRIWSLINEDAPVGIQWRESAITGDSWVIPNGAPESDVALDFISFATRPEVCAAFSREFPFGPTNSNAFRLLDPEFAQRLPGSGAHNDSQFTINFDWWFRNGEAAQGAFEEWLEELPLVE